MEDKKKDTQDINFLENIRNKFARLYTLNSAGPVRCQIIDVVNDPLDRKMLHVYLVGQINFYIYFDQITAYEIYDDIQQLKRIVSKEEENEINDFDSDRRGRNDMLYMGGGDIVQP